MKRNKRLNEKRIELTELDTIPENRKRIFKISYTERGGVIRYEKIFQRKRYVRQLLDDPNIEKIKLYIGDVVYEQPEVQ